MSSLRGSRFASRGGNRHRPRRDPSQSPIRSRKDHSKEFNKSLEKITICSRLLQPSWINSNNGAFRLRVALHLDTSRKAPSVKP